MQVQTMAVLAAVCLSACAREAQGERMHVVSTSLKASQVEVDAVLAAGEALYPEIVAFHPSDIVMDDAIRVELHGRYTNVSPYVDDEGTMHLWRFSEGEGGYHAMFAHELVHAVAYDSLVAPALDDFEHTGFYLEGWAEYVALEVDPGKTGFPLFGHHEDVVVGHWLQQGGPTLGDYRDQHEALSLPCQGQSYILRASWFRYVDQELGRDVLHKLADVREGMPPETAEAILGAPLPQVDADWEAWATARYDAQSDADAQAEAYRGRMGWYEPCLD